MFVQFQKLSKEIIDYYIIHAKQKFNSQNIPNEDILLNYLAWKNYNCIEALFLSENNQNDFLKFMSQFSPQEFIININDI